MHARLDQNMRHRLEHGKSQKGQSAPLDNDAARLEERKKMVVGLTNTAIDSLKKKSIHLIMTDKQKSSQMLMCKMFINNRTS